MKVKTSQRLTIIFVFILALFLCFSYFTISAQTTELVKWEYPNYNSTSSSLVPTSGVNKSDAYLTNSKGNISSNGKKCPSLKDWTNGNEYWEIAFSTTGYNNIRLSADIFSAETGPRDFKVIYSINNGQSWSDTGIIYKCPYKGTMGTVLNAVSLPAGCYDCPKVIVRLVQTSKISARAGEGGRSSSEVTQGGGTNQINNIIVSGDKIGLNTTSISVSTSYITITSPSTTINANDGIMEVQSSTTKATTSQTLALTTTTQTTTTPQTITSQTYPQTTTTSATTATSPAVTTTTKPITTTVQTTQNTSASATTPTATKPVSTTTPTVTTTPTATTPAPVTTTEIQSAVFDFACDKSIYENETNGIFSFNVYNNSHTSISDATINLYVKTPSSYSRVYCIPYLSVQSGISKKYSFSAYKFIENGNYQLIAQLLLSNGNKYEKTINVYVNGDSETQTTTTSVTSVTTAKTEPATSSTTTISTTQKPAVTTAVVSVIKPSEIKNKLQAFEQNSASDVKIVDIKNNSFNSISIGINKSDFDNKTLAKVCSLSDAELSVSIEKIVKAVSSMNVTQPSKEAVDKLNEISKSTPSGTKIIPVNFSEHMVFDFPVKVSVAVDKGTFPKGNYNLYYYNPETDAVEYCGPASVDDNGLLTFSLKHCSDYFLSEIPLSDNIKTIEPTNNPMTESTFALIIVIAIIGVSVFACIVQIRKSYLRMNNSK